MCAEKFSRHSHPAAAFCRKDIMNTFQGSRAIDCDDKRFPAQRRGFKIRI